MAPNPQLVALAETVAQREGVPSALVKGVIETESAWNPNAVSGVGAVGLMQVMPATAKGLGWDPATPLNDPLTNVTLGIRYLRQMLSIFGGDWAKAAAAYNHGPGIPGPGARGNWPGVRGKIAKAGGDWEKAQDYLPTETRLYWRKVLNWSAVWAGKITRTEALIASKAGEVSAAVMDWAKSSTGKSTMLLLLCLGISAALIAGGRK